MRGPRSQDYAPLPLSEKEPLSHRSRRDQRSKGLGIWVLRALGACVVLYGASNLLNVSTNKSCDSVNEGYRCSPKTSHFWGQYSLWYSVPSDINVAPPKGCEVTFANVLSRHGGRDPTLGKTLAYHILIADIQNTSTSYPKEFRFLKDYDYTLGADELTDAGRQEMVNSGAHFYRRYQKLIDDNVPFVRAGGQHRVVESAEKWLAGVAQSLKEEPRKIDVHLRAVHIMVSGIGRSMSWADKFVPPIQQRINSALGTNLSATSIVYLMDIIFTEKEWREYDYFQTLGKFYGYGVGNPLGPTQGVGYSSDPETFPLDRKVYADFSHDNDISGVLAALGLYNRTKPLSNTTIEDTKKTHGYSAAWSVPFAARLYVEKLQCKHEKEELVRVIVNDRVHPLDFCGGDKHGRCTLSKFVDSQSFARSGGLWDQCYE
ncbi:unnamed protein product [Alternaria alternata]